MTLQKLSEMLGGELVNANGELTASHAVRGIAAIDRAKVNEVSFLIQPEYMKFASSTLAGCVIVGAKLEDCSRPQIIHKKPYWAFAMTSQFFAPRREHSGKISEASSVAKSAVIGRNVTIMPFAVIDEDAVIGDDCVIYSGVYIGRKVKIGRSTEIRSNAVIEDSCVIGERVLIHGGSVIGADGFGFAPGESDIAKIPQIGNVVIGNDVEIGGLSTIDRAAMGETKIGNGVKIDSAAHIAHNVQIGDHSMVCGGVHVAGSAKIGQWNILAGASNVTNHVVTAPRVTIGGMAGVTKSIDESGEYMGFPAVPVREWRRQIASLRRLEGLAKRVAEIEKALAHSAKKTE